MAYYLILCLSYKRIIKQLVSLVNPFHTPAIPDLEGDEQPGPVHKGLCVDVGVSIPANTKTIQGEGRAWDRAG